jgi:hypothetical protein
MNSENSQNVEVNDPQAKLEVAFLEEFLAIRGSSLATLNRLPEAEARRLMTEASLYASAKLSEVETRSQFVSGMHGLASPS